jgi:hypothetical protein
MSRYTPEQIARIRAESARLLRDDPPPRSEPRPDPPREVRIPTPDPVQEWRDWHDARDREREANRAELRRQEGDNARVLSAIGRVAELERRVVELEQSLATSDAMMQEFAQGAETFSRAVDEVLLRMEKKLAELDRKFVELRAVDDLHRRGVIDMPSPLMRRVN